MRLGRSRAPSPTVRSSSSPSTRTPPYSPCGIPYVHGKEIPSFEALFLATKEAYVEQGIDIRYETRVASLDLEAGTVEVEGQGDVGYDRLILATGFDYADPACPARTSRASTTSRTSAGPWSGTRSSTT